MGEPISREHEQAALSLKPQPTLRDPAQPSTEGVSVPQTEPKQDATAPSVEQLQAQLAEVNAARERAEKDAAARLQQNALKDKAIEDLRAQVQPPPADESEEDRTVRLARETAEQAIREKQKALEPLIEKAQRANAVLEEQAAVTAWTQEVVAKYAEEAKLTQQRFPGMSLSEALSMVVPRTAPATETAPATHVEGAPSAPPAQPKSPVEQRKELLGQVASLRRQGRNREADALNMQAMKLRIGHWDVMRPFRPS